ncbi:helix-turn-helix transcriptional regulator [Paramagnetospirillum magneticum]|uniref:Helix-turn-helix domain-containing protein n=1 Tax=Paramagnetospirillum magneticum (strain ATCC 700264 / AMB-1) TaxID=342108 RepID=Q2W6M8_PARM1|nr:helix-turn-helix domain-containing protein [Paramagnetospirillum magneticum]BAE50497.1 hypothetical protein amb1693 [Paramagnetospirillum magneticum AMB-1]
MDDFQIAFPDVKSIPSDHSDLLDGFIPLTAVAKSLGVSLRTMQRYNAQRIGPPCIRVGKMVLCRIEAVREWLKSRETAPVRPRR